MLKALVFTSVTFVLTLAVSMIVAVIIHLIGKIVQGKKTAGKIAEKTKVAEKSAPTAVVESRKVVLS